jgi:GTP-binding protein
MIITSSEFITSAVKPSQYPPADLPEIAFAGRSNVGKSSLINKLLNRKRLVKTSNTPGRTQLINFFIINACFRFVDLPGFGYARVPAHIKKQWAPMIETYLSSRQTLRGVVLIMDIRRDPGEYELNLIDWLGHHGIPEIRILTKADKLSRTKQVHRQQLIADRLATLPDQLIRFSTKSGQGKSDVWEAVEKWTQI